MSKFLLIAALAMLLVTPVMGADTFTGFPNDNALVDGQGYERDSSWMPFEFVGTSTVGAAAYLGATTGDSVTNCLTSTAKTWIAPESGVTFEIASSSASDTLEGSAALTVRGWFIDDDGDLNIEDLTLIGQTVISTTGTDYIACIGLKVLTCGTAEAAAGDIYAAADDTFSSGVPQTASKIWCKIPAGYGCSQNAFGWVPAGTKGRITSLNFSNNACGGYARYLLIVRPWKEGGEQVIKRWDVNDQSNPVFEPIDLPEKCYFDIRAYNSTATTEVQVSGTYELK